MCTGSALRVNISSDPTELLTLIKTLNTYTIVSDMADEGGFKFDDAPVHDNRLLQTR